jgi:hypothetical protein
MENNILKNIFNDEFLENLAKSADLYKIGTNSVLDPEEIRIGLKVVPRAVMSMLIAELVPMEINSHKDIKLPFGKEAYMAVNKNAADDFTGSVYSDKKLVYDFKNRSIPGLGIILLSTFELYDMEEIDKPSSVGSLQGNEDMDKKVQKLIDERMEFHSLVSKVVEEKMAQREAIHKLMMVKLNEVLKGPSPSQMITPPVSSPVTPLEVKPSDVIKKEGEKGVHAPLFTDAKATTPGIKAGQGMSSMGYNVRNPRPGMVDPKVKASAVLEQQRKMPIPNLPKSENMIKKEKGSPLKSFLDRKKEPVEHRVEMMKSETIGCDSCGQTIFGNMAYSGCLCFGENSESKIWVKKTEDGVQLRFSRGWSIDNIEMLLETLRKNNGKN